MHACVRFLYLFLITISIIIPGYLPARSNDDENPERREQKFIHFRYGSEIAVNRSPGGIYTAHAVPPTPSDSQIQAGQVRIKETLKPMEGRTLDVADTLKVYASAGEGGFHAIHGSIGSGDISSKVNRELGLGRQKFHEEVLIELAKIVQPKTKGLGINDFGSGADPAKINAKGDIDFTLYAKAAGVEAEWLVDQYNKTFRNLAKSKYGVDITPDQMDIVAHRYDATIPDWRTRENIADFEVKLRTGTKLLKANPEAYFLEGAYLQQIMGRSIKPGKKTFTWFVPDSSQENGIRKISINASQVPQFFYNPKQSKGLGFGGAVGNYHFHHAHSDSFIDKTKYVLRSLDNGPGLLIVGKRGDYQDIGSMVDVTEGKKDDKGRQERRRIVDDLYDSPQMRYSKDLRDEIFETYEICRKARIAKDKGKHLSDAEIYSGLVDHIKKISLVKIDDATALKMAKQTFNSTSELILTSNVIRSAKSRARDWLRPHTLKERISFEDENGNLVSVRAGKEDLKRLQFSAFREIHDAIQILQQDNKHHVIEQLKKQNPVLKKDIEIIENIIKRKREMMLAPEGENPETKMSYRQKAAQGVIDAWDQMGQQAEDSPLWDRALKNAKDAWATGQALENYIYSNLTSAVIFGAGKKYGPVFEHMRQSTEATNKMIMDPVWMTRISRANSVVHILTLYVEEGSFNEKVIKEAVIEGLSHFPLIGMPIDIYRGTVSSLLNYDGSATGLVKVTAGSGLGQIVLSQFIPGYGPVILVVNTAKGVVRLGGTVLFTPLKNQRIKLAYQGYLDPVDIEPGSALYEHFLKQTGTEEIRNTIAWWMNSTGRKDRIYSPRPSVLHPIDPDMKMSVEERRKAVLKYFQPQIAALFKQRWGDAATVKGEPNLYAATESEFLPKIMYKHVHEWWEGKGVFSEYDSLAVKRMMDEYYGQEMKSKLSHMLISDYIAGKGELIKQENEWYTSLKKLFAIAAGYLEAYTKTYMQDLLGIREAHKQAAMYFMGLEQEDAQKIAPKIEIVSSPKVILGKDQAGNELPIVEKINIRAKVQASDTAEHPAPFRIGFEIKTAKHSKNLAESDDFSFKMTPDEIPKDITIRAIAYDANNKPFHAHDITIPIIYQQASAQYDGGDSLEEVFERMEALAEKAEEMASETVEKSNETNTKLNTASGSYNRLVAEKNKKEKNLPLAEQHLKDILGMIGSAQNSVASGESSVGKLNSTAGKARELSNEICESIAQINNDPSNRNMILSQNTSKTDMLKSLLPAGRKERENYASTKQHVHNRVKQIDRKLNDSYELIDPRQNSLDEGGTLDLLIDADLSGAAAKENLAVIKDILTDADLEYAKGKAFIADLSNDQRGHEMQNRLDGLMERIKKAEERARTAVASFKGKVDKLTKDLLSMGRQIETVNNRIQKFLNGVKQSKSDREKLSQKADDLEKDQQFVDESIRQIETAILDADICSENVQNAAQEQNLNECNEITQLLNTAYKNNDTRTYNDLLVRYRNCPQYETAQNIYNQMIHRNNQCNDLTNQLNAANKSGDSRTYGVLLNQYKDCAHYNQAVSIYNSMLQTDRYCNEITNQLNAASSRGDIRTYQSLLDGYKNCNHYNDALAVYNNMVRDANNRHCTTLLAQLNDAQRRRDVAAYGRLLNQARNCSFYNQAYNIYTGMQNQQNLQAFNNMLSGLMGMINQQNSGGSTPPPRPGVNSGPPVNRPPQNTGEVTANTGGMSRDACEKKFCPVCATGGSVDLLGVSVNKQCNDCRARYKTKIEDCMRGGVSANRPDNTMSQFRNYQVVKCRVPIKDYQGRVMYYKDIFDFSGPNRGRPANANCTVVQNGTWEECIDLARKYNQRYNTGHNVLAW